MATAQSIADWYNTCIVIFGKISASIDNSGFDPGNDAKALVVTQLVRDQIGRLRVWAGNMGAHRVGRMSLDYKLKEASHIHAAVLELLKELNGSLTESAY